MISIHKVHTTSGNVAADHAVERFVAATTSIAHYFGDGPTVPPKRWVGPHWSPNSSQRAKAKRRATHRARTARR